MVENNLRETIEELRPIVNAIRLALFCRALDAMYQIHKQRQAIGNHAAAEGIEFIIPEVNR